MPFCYAWSRLCSFATSVPKREPIMDRDKWLGCILDATRDLADERYQERVWVRGAGPEVDSSTEALVRLMG